MEDLTYGYRRPCVMDIKMGTKTCADDANSLKKHYMISKDKSTTSYKHGLRIVASKVWSVKTSDFVVFSRGFCNNISTEEQLERYLLSFFHSYLIPHTHTSASVTTTNLITSTLSSTLNQFYPSDSDEEYDTPTQPENTVFENPLVELNSPFDFGRCIKEIRVDVMNYFIGQLEVLYKWMSTQNIWRFYSSSLLFVYEGDVSAPSKADLSMIDFAHVYDIKDKEGVDLGYTAGLRKLLEILKNFVQKHQSQVV